jgi:hypothetical protein
VALSLVVGLAARPGLAEEPRSPQSGDGSGHVVRWEVEVDGKKIALASPSGEMARITTQDGLVLGLVPVQGSGGNVTFRLFDVTMGRNGIERSEAMDEVQAEPGVAAFSKARADIALTLLPGDRQAPDKAAAQAGMAQGLPLSDMLIRWTLVQPDGREVLLMVREGEVARVGLEGQWYALAPLVTDRAAGTVSFRVFRLSQSKAASGPRLLEGFELPMGAEHASSSLMGVRLRLGGVLEVPREAPKSAVAASRPNLGDGEVIANGCCLRCGSTEACGCSVSMDCGDCCSPPCCARVY